METLLFAVLIVGGLAAYATRFSAAAKLRRQLGGARRYTIAALPEGQRGRVHGTTRVLDGTLTSPLFGRPCVYYFVEVEQSRDNVPAVVARETNGVPFVLDDGTGRAIVDPLGAKVALDFDREHATAWGAVTPAQREFLMREGRGELGPDDELYLREVVIEVGHEVAVAGTGVREPDPHGVPNGYRGELPTRLRLSSTPAHRLVIGPPK